ncbi:hypothetical protein ACFL1B_04270 [Nanoarchaeota archaeon]
MKKTLIVFFLFFLLCNQAIALKVEGRVTIPFEPNLEYKGDVCIIPEGISYLYLEPQGDIADLIELEVTEIDLSEGPGCVKYSFTLPSEMRPGIRTSQIMIMEKPPEGGAMISAVVHIGHQIFIDVPYPGKWLEIDLQIPNKESGEEVPMKTKIRSRGEEVINIIKGKVDIYNWDDELVDTLDTNTVTNLASQGSSELIANWDSTGHPSGDYNAIATVTYDGSSETDDAIFKLGSMEVRLVEHTNTVFYRKGIVPFRLIAESYWSELIPRIKAHVDVYNGTTKLTEFDTLTQDIEPWKKKELDGYLDANVLGLETYDIKINLSFSGFSRIYDSKLVVAEEPVPEVYEPSIFERLGKTKILLISTIILAILALLIILKLLFWDKSKRRNV